MRLDELPDEIPVGTEVEVTVRLPSATIWSLREIRRIAALPSLEQAMSRSTSNEVFLLQEMQNGSKVLISRNGKIREVILPPWASPVG